MRAVPDTNVLVSALLAPGGTPAIALQAWLSGRFQLVLSPALLAEASDVLSRPRIVRLLPTRRHPSEFLQLLESRAILVEPSVELHVIGSDPDDDRVLEAAMAGRADVIVSGDSHLTSLGAYGSIPIVTPARFMAMLRETSDE